MSFFKKLWNGIKKVVTAPVRVIKKVVTAPVKLIKNLVSPKAQAAPQQEIQYQTEPSQQQQIAQFEAQNSMRPTSYQSERIQVHGNPQAMLGGSAPPQPFY